MDRSVMIVLIVAIVMTASVIRSIFGLRHRRERNRNELMPAQASAETQRLRDEVRQLKERLAVIERITVEKESSLEREIERLRDR